MNNNKKIIFLKQLFFMLKADGKIDEMEKRFLKDIALSMNIDTQEIKDILDLQEIIPTPPVKFSKKENIIQIYRLALMLKIDGNIAPQEIKVIKNIGLEMGLSIEALDIMLEILLKKYSTTLTDNQLFKIFDIQNN